MKWLLVILVALASAACRDREIAKLSSVRDDVCKCKTVACAETAMKSLPTGKVQSTPRSQKVAREMLNCLHDLYELARPTTDPDAEATP